MLNNEDLKLIENLIEYLSQLRGSKAMYFSNELDKIYCKVINSKKLNSKKVNEYNKKNKKRHNLLNQLCYYRKTNNQAKVKELEEKLKENLTI